MKLKNKLLPLVGISAACAAVAPLALTSCTNSDLVDLTEIYYSQIEEYKDILTKTASEAADFYFKACQDAPEIIEDDFYWSRARANTNYFNKKNVTNINQKEAELEKGEELKEIEAALADLAEAKQVFVAAPNYLNMVSVDTADDVAAAIAEAAENMEQKEKDEPVAEVDTTSTAVLVDNEKISDFSVSKVSYKLNDLEYNTWALSFKLDFEYTDKSLGVSVEVKDLEDKDSNASASKKVVGTESGVANQDIKGSMVFHNVPVKLRYNNKTNYMSDLWGIYVDDTGTWDYYSNYVTIVDLVMAMPSNNTYITLDINFESSGVSSKDSTQYSTVTNHNFTIDSNFNWTAANEKYKWVDYWMRYIYASHWMWNIAYNDGKR